MDAQLLLKAFKTKFPTKYKFPTDEPMGIGHYGAVFKAVDVDRSVDVAIKIHHHGLTPEGSERGWKITSNFNHTQVATTFTVEEFETTDGITCKAIVTRLIPGKPLAKYWEICEELTDDKEKAFMAEDFAFTLIPSLLEVLFDCHRNNYGHGDLHDGNIMVFLTELNERFTSHVVLIDFDNSSIQTEVYCPTEKEKIEKDYGLLKRILRNTLCDWEWFELVEPLHAGYTHVTPFRKAYLKLIEFIQMAKKNKLSHQTILKFLSDLVHYGLAGTAVQPIISGIKIVSEKSGKDYEFQIAYEDFQEQLKKYDNWTVDVEMEIIENSQAKTRIYNKILGK